MKIKTYYQYLMYVLEHKKNVFKVCWKKKMYKHAFTHDLSKFCKKEFIPYAKYFYIDKDTYKAEFKQAWEHHYKNNPHHWQYWLDENKQPKSIPEKHIMEMISDWEAMGLKFKDTAQSYYLKNYDSINLEYNTRVLLEYMLNLNPSIANNYGHTLKEFANMHDEQQYNLNFGYIKENYGVDTYKILK